MIVRLQSLQTTRKIWKRDSTCKAQALLEKMFLENKIEPSALPAFVYKQSPEFQKYSLNVFRTAFNEIKAKSGLALKPYSHNAALCFDEASDVSPGVSLHKRVILFEGKIEGMNDFDSLIVHGNQPVQMSVYQDPVTRREKLVVVVALIGGVGDAKFSLVGDGPGTRTARIDYSWPVTAVDIEAIFQQEIQNGEIPSCHPLIEALKKDLEKSRSSVEEISRGMELTLPISVQTVANSISITGKRNKDGTKYLVVILMGYQTAYTIKEKDKIVIFKDM
ncbi:uncharacterized protein LOC116930516 [Daphnia magna]|uniref:uncharacterized protein LOC116930516 n=1 Tax=Daphnia magna TaxID=35525 RepID=UPI001E1BA3D1|nr:uncharacterized protein LOC116930516 [Daphnia magna]